jgi:hypothetical protein
MLLTTFKVKTDARAIGVEIDSDALHVSLADGRIVSAPLEWFPKLRDAQPEQIDNWRLIGSGIGIHWESLDEDISVWSLLAIQ